jgi:hypothetical protein
LLSEILEVRVRGVSEVRGRNSYSALALGGVLTFCYTGVILII